MSSSASPFLGPITVGLRRAVASARDIAAKLHINDPHWMVPPNFEPDLDGLVHVAEQLVKATVLLMGVSEQEARTAVRAVLSRGRHWTYYQAPVGPAGAWFEEIRVAVEHKSYGEPFRVIQGGARFPRVWCPELSVLDAEHDGERWLWHVPARPGNDVETANRARCSTMRNRGQCAPAKGSKSANRCRCSRHEKSVRAHRQLPGSAREPFGEGPQIVDFAPTVAEAITACDENTGIALRPTAGRIEKPGVFLRHTVQRKRLRRKTVKSAPTLTTWLREQDGGTP